MKRWHDGKVLVALGAVALAALLFILINKSSSDNDNGDTSSAQAGAPTQKQTNPGAEEAPASKETTATTPTEPTIVVRGGEPVGGVAELSFDAGDEIRFRVRSDVSDEVHIHGYDVSEEVAAGSSVSFAFPADIEGIFEVELEQRAVPIAELRVNP